MLAKLLCSAFFPLKRLWWVIYKTVSLDCPLATEHVLATKTSASEVGQRVRIWGYVSLRA